VFFFRSQSVDQEMEEEVWQTDNTQGKHEVENFEE
jgi:hypothetical protein